MDSKVSENVLGALSSTFVPKPCRCFPVNVLVQGALAWIKEKMDRLFALDGVLIAIVS
jgi:hypothetical protein